MQEILSKKDIGERIKNLRLEAGLSQSAIADVLEISRSNYSQIEIGNQFPTFHTLHLIASYYSRSYDWILHGNHYTSKTPPNELLRMISTMETMLGNFTNSIKVLNDELAQIKHKHF